MSKANNKLPWYSKEDGLFSPSYVKDFEHITTNERTKLEIDFLEKVLKLKKGVKILDLACGYGRHSIELARRGYKVTGVDINSSLLKEAKRLARKSGVTITWVESDMRNLPFKESFDFILNLFTSFGYFDNDEDDKLIVQKVAQALKPGGQFVLDVDSRDSFVRNFTKIKCRKSSDDAIVLIERKFNFAESRIYAERTRISASGKRKKEYPTLRIYTLTELIALCQSEGLTFMEAYGAYDGQKISFDSERCIVISEKRIK